MIIEYIVNFFNLKFFKKKKKKKMSLDKRLRVVVIQD